MSETVFGLNRQGATQSVDERILLLLRNPADLSDPIGPHWLEEMGRDFTALGGVGVLVGVGDEVGVGVGVCVGVGVRVGDGVAVVTLVGVPVAVAAVVPSL